ncbi:kinesin-related protein 4-like [Aricia agestis]|uniref:kinesin-related protein 4-like n=1 Tax=Aricia agestis TaxID=91739 RepID=UPI001C20A5DA|nr:kinesin-related protein 4-like [Aricia agestis]
MGDNIKVVVKVRPLIAREIESKLSYQWRVNNNTITQIDNAYPHSFTFDKVYDKDTKTTDVYDDIAKPIVEAALSGFNGTIFAYGQTSSGKTYTMTGTDDAPGIIPLAVYNIFDRIKDIPDREFLVRVSYIEIYNEKLIDLLDVNKCIKIMINNVDGRTSVDATERVTTSPEEVLQVMEEGKANRQTGFTNMNEESSRSHSIFQITIESREHIEGDQASSVNVSQLNLVDLAGSERAGQTGATGKRFKEGTHINKSLSTLALVIKQLSENQRGSENQHVNYRDSKLTRILQNSLGGNAKTGIICAVTPAHVDETISTLQFASRAKAIKNTPAVNTVATNETMIQNLTKELSVLKTQLEGKKNLEQDNHNLQNKIAMLQSLILNGIVQRSTTDMGGARRKLNAPRRNTISTLHPIEEDDLPEPPRKPKFCTPSLKYNPAMINASEFKPIQKTASLSCVDEEPRLVTPPPTEKKVNFNNEVIEIDSDDDNSTLSLVCSPYHKCRDETKTPPCILKKNAKLAEKNLKDIMELTEREKIFSPNVTELMESIEKKSSTIAKLEDDVDKLSKITREKDVKIENLRGNIEKVEREIANLSSEKGNFEKLIKEYETKLTDSEVTIDVLKNKAKIREQELLSLLRNNSSKKTYESAGINTSFICAENGNNEHDDALITDLQTQLKLKEETIIELHERISQQTNIINDLKTCNKDFEKLLNTHKDHVTLLESDNATQKTELDKLNAVIKEQKDLIESMNTQVESYCNSTQELQFKLDEKDNILKEFIIAVDIEGMLAYDEVMVASTDNLKNMIQSLKINLQNTKEEISKINNTNESSKNYCDVLKELESSREQIKSLTEELTKVKMTFNENCCDKTEITEENSNLQKIISDLNIELSKLQEERNLLQNQNDAYQDEVTKLKECVDLLNVKIVGREQDSESMKRQNEELSKKIFAIECDIGDNNKKISSLEEQLRNTQTCVDDIKLLLDKVSKITSLLSENVRDVPLVVDDLVIALKIFGDSLDTLENAVLNIVKQKDDMAILIEKQELEVDRYQSILIENSKSIEDFTCECVAILETNVRSENKALTDSSDSNNQVNDGCDYLKDNLRNLIESIKITKSHFTEELDAKRIEINKLLCSNTSKESELDEVKSQISKLEEEVNNRDKLLSNVLNRCSQLTTELAIENNISCEFDTNTENIFEKIILTLEKISNYVTVLKAENIDESDNTKNAISNAKSEILKLTEENLQLINNIDILENVKLDLSAKLKQVVDKNDLFIINLRKCKELLDSLKRDVQSNLQEFKYGFSNLNDLFKEHIINRIRNEYSDLLDISKPDSQNVLNELKLDVTENVNSKYSNVDINSRETLHSPPSLLTICCNTIADALDQDNKDKLSSSESSTCSTNFENVCQCEQLLLEIQSLREDKEYLTNKISSLQKENEELVSEQEIVQKEVRSLIDSSHELQKKLINHRTNLSTLMATTYAENKSLTSQIKCLQHYYSRFYSGCQKDIPSFKKQLQDLMVLLKTENLPRHNDSFKRYSLPDTLDNTLIQTIFKNESMLDGDLLMLDTNVSLTTCDNTLLGADQTGLEITQINYCREVGCQTSDYEDRSSNLYSQVEAEKIANSLEELREENDKLRKVVDEYFDSKTSKTNLVDSTCSPAKDHCNAFSECKHLEQLNVVEREFSEKYQILSKKLSDMESQKSEVENKFDKLNLEMPNVDALTRKLNAFEKELQSKQNNIDKLTSSLRQMEKLQEENEDLSNQVMDYVLEIDTLKAEHEILKNEKTDLLKKLENDVESKQSTETSDGLCLECKIKDQAINELRDKLSSDSYSRLNRSYSDSESSSRYNKLCTLQSELHAGKEDCIELKESVATIKNHLDGSPNHQPMDMDISMEQPHIFSLNEELADNKNSKGDSIDPLDIYNVERINCYNFLIEKTDDATSVLDSNMKIIDVMTMLYEKLVLKHSNEVQNLRNCLKDFEEEKLNLDKRVASLKVENDKVMNDYNERNQYLQTMAEVVLSLKNNLTLMEDMSVPSDIIVYFKDNFLARVDSEFGLQGSSVFEKLINTMQNEHCHKILDKEQHNQSLQEQLKNIQNELSTVSENLAELKSALANKENEYNLLNQKKEQIHEINNAVTLDIIKKERDLRETVKTIYKRVTDSDIPHVKDLDISLPLNDIIKLLFEITFNHLSQTSSDQSEQLKILNEDFLNSKNQLIEKEKELESLKEQNIAIKAQNDINAASVSDLQQKLLEYENLNKVFKENYDRKIQDNVAQVANLTEKINMLKEEISNKEMKIIDLESRLISKDEQNNFENEKLTEAMKSVAEANKVVEELKSVNERIVQDKDTLSKELEEANKTIAQYKQQLEKLSNDILVLKESVKENIPTVDKLSSEIQLLQQEKKELYNKLQEMAKECTQLQVNIKTHEKTAEIQSKMIIKTRKQKEDAELESREKDKKLEEMEAKCKQMQEECDRLSKDIKTAKDDLTTLQSTKHLLEARVSELEQELEEKRGRMSVGSVTRRRRQSIHDARRTHDSEDERRLEAMFKCQTPTEDMFMDVDSGSSRSTPVRHSRGRDSISSKHEQSEEDHGTSVSVQARSRRRSLHDRSRLLPVDNHVQNNSHNSSGNTSLNSEVQLKKRLAACEEELSELKERYRELDDECETCASYLREAEDRCARLKHEKTQLESKIEELNKNLLLSAGPVERPMMTDAHVNTDEDWSNLHTVVVDRMSYDAEVEKNKKLMKSIEELRFSKQHLKNTIEKMQKALDKNSSKDKKELESTRAELEACRQQLAEYKERCRELDEECDTCASYLRDRDEQCRKLREAKAALESKLAEYIETSPLAQSVRKKRHSVHDRRRADPPRDASTDTDDFANNKENVSQNTSDVQGKDYDRLRALVSRLSAQKAELEEQLAAFSASPIFVATGSAIVQNQQITDVLKENQKLKKMNAKLISMCKKRGKTTDSNRENEDPSEVIG